MTKQEKAEYLEKLQARFQELTQKALPLVFTEEELSDALYSVQTGKDFVDNDAINITLFVDRNSLGVVIPLDDLYTACERFGTANGVHTIYSVKGYSLPHKRQTVEAHKSKNYPLHEVNSRLFSFADIDQDIGVSLVKSILEQAKKYELQK